MNLNLGENFLESDNGILLCALWTLTGNNFLEFCGNKIDFRVIKHT